MKNKNVVATVAVTLIAILGMTILGRYMYSVFVDEYTIYDDFTNNIDLDKWVFYEASGSDPGSDSTNTNYYEYNKLGAAQKTFSYGGGASCSGQGELMVCVPERISYSEYLVLTKTDSSVGLINVVEGISSKKLVMTGGSTVVDTAGNVHYDYDEITSKKLFSSEDIRISVRAKAQTPGEGGSNTIKRFYSTISFGSLQNYPLYDESEFWLISQNPPILGYEKDRLVEIKRYDDTDLTKFVLLIDGVEVATSTNPVPAPIILKGTMDVYEVRFNPYYSCQINYSTDVVVRDRFDSGSAVNMTSLTYSAVKFCPEDLGVLIFSDEGVTDEKGSITKSIAEGKTLVVPSGEYWQIDYITKYVTNMSERCGVGQAYNTRTKKCVGIATQQVPTQTLLFCAKDDDCVVPKKCNDAIVHCVNNQCEYDSTECTPEQIINEIIVKNTTTVYEPQLFFIQTPDNYLRTEGGVVAGKQLSSTKPKPSQACCDSVVDDYVLDRGCYETNISFGGIKKTLIDSQTFSFNNVMNITYSFKGDGAYNGLYDGNQYNCEYMTENDYGNEFLIRFNSVFSIGKMVYTPLVKLNSDYKLVFAMKNNLWEMTDSGYYLREVEGIINSNPGTTRITKSYAVGDNTISVPLKTDKYGMHTATITPFFVMGGGKEYIHNQGILVSYYVGDTNGVTNATNANTTITKYTCKELGCPDNYVCENEVCVLDNMNCAFYESSNAEGCKTNTVMVMIIGVVFVLMMITWYLWLQLRR